MNIFLPNDVSNYIFIFLFFSTSFKKLFCLSKFTTKSLKNTVDYKEYMEFMSKVKMLREDKMEHLKDNNLEKKWLYYNLSKWPLLSNEINEDCEIYKVGNFVDAKDFLNAWCQAKIIDCYPKYYFSIDNNGVTITNRRQIYEVEFMGWSSSFNERIGVDKIRKLSTFTISPHDKMRNFYKYNFEKFWCLIKKPHEKKWNMEKITDRTVDLSKNKILINTKSEIVYQINLDNVNNCLLPISDALCFLVNKENHTFKSSNRMFYL